MNQFAVLVRDALRAGGACWRACWALLECPVPSRPFVSKNCCVETISFIHLLLAEHFPGPHDVNWAQGRWIATDLGDGRPMRLVRLAADGSLVFRQQDSVVRVVVLPPGSVIPGRFDSQCKVALAAVTPRRAL